MRAVTNVNEAGTTVFLDDVHFINCKYSNCLLVFTGGDFGWTNTTFENCRLSFDGAAGRTVNVLRLFSLLSPNFGGPPQSTLANNEDAELSQVIHAI